MCKLYTSQFDDNRQLLRMYVEDDVQGIDINDCTSKSQKCIAIYISTDHVIHEISFNLLSMLLLLINIQL